MGHVPPSHSQQWGSQPCWQHGHNPWDPTAKAPPACPAPPRCPPQCPAACWNTASPRFLGSPCPEPSSPLRASHSWNRTGCFRRSLSWRAAHQTRVISCNENREGQGCSTQERHTLRWGLSPALPLCLLHSDLEVPGSIPTGHDPPGTGPYANNSWSATWGGN